MRAGKLRHRLTLESPGETVGDSVVTWTTTATVWGSMEGLSGVDRGALIADAAHRFRIRHRSGVTPKMRVGLGTRKFGIISALDPDGRQRELVITAQEIV